MDSFREYYIRMVIPLLKKMERERRKLLIKALIVMGLTVLLITPIVIYIGFLSHNFNSIVLYGFVPLPATFLLKKSYSNFSGRFKWTIIQEFFLNFFDRFSIEIKTRKDDLSLFKTGLFPVKEKNILESEDFITVWQADKKVELSEIMISEFKNYQKIAYFHGILITIPINNFPEQTVYIRNQEVLEDAFEEIKFQRTIEEQLILYSQEKCDIGKLQIWVDFAKNEQLSISIVESNLHCLLQIENIGSRYMEIFNPTLVFSYNSTKTYKRIRDEYCRIAKISTLIKKLLELEKKNQQ